MSTQGGALKKLFELLAPTILAVIVFGSMMHTRVTVVENKTEIHGKSIDKMQESWMSLEDVRELKAVIRDLANEVTKLKVEVAKDRYAKK
jgi:hypothetical protein